MTLRTSLVALAAAIALLIGPLSAPSAAGAGDPAEPSPEAEPLVTAARSTDTAGERAAAERLLGLQPGEGAADPEAALAALRAADGRLTSADADRTLAASLDPRERLQAPTLPAAMEALLDGHEATSPSSPAAFSPLPERVPASLQEPLAELVVAFLAFEDAAAQLYAHAPGDPGPGAAMSARLTLPVPPAWQQLLVARQQLATAAAGLAAAYEALPADADDDLPVVHEPPIVSLDLAGENSTYHRDVVLLVDAGGNDTYSNNAGGNRGDSDCGLTGNPAAALVDLDGQDTYGDPEPSEGCGVNGGGYQGAGALMDLGGNDAYHAAGLGANGGGVLGAGLLVDAGGEDDYLVSLRHGPVALGPRPIGGANGGGLQGLGTLVDLGGADEYRVSAPNLGFPSGGVNGGGYEGVGALVDLDGSDVYEVEDETLGPSGGANGGAVGGSGFLVDAVGDDVYHARALQRSDNFDLPGTGGVNGGSLFGTGFLLDGRGDDVYEGLADSEESLDLIEGGVNGGTAAGTALLADLSGDDRYDACCRGTNGETRGVASALVDLTGMDRYSDPVVDCEDCSRVPKGGPGGAQLDGDDPPTGPGLLDPVAGAR